MSKYSHLVGIPYKNNGRDEKGLDCYGLVMQVYKILGIELPDYNSVPEPEPWLINEMIKNNEYDWIKLGKYEIPCVVTFWMTNPDFTSHIGVVIEEDRFIHARGTSVCVERLSSPVWSKRIKGFYRWKNQKQN